MALDFGIKPARVVELEKSIQAHEANGTQWLAYQKSAEAQLLATQGELAAAKTKLSLAQHQTQSDAGQLMTARSQLKDSQGKVADLQSQLIAIQASLAASLRREATAAQTLALAGATASTLVESLMQKIEVIEGEKETLWRRPFRMPFAGESNPPTPDSILSHVGGALLPFFDMKETLLLRGVCREFKGVVWKALTTGGGKGGEGWAVALQVKTPPWRGKAPRTGMVLLPIKHVPKDGFNDLQVGCQVVC
jgi:hypothetical protein